MSNTPLQSHEKNELLGLVRKNPPVAGLVAPRYRPCREGTIPPRRAHQSKHLHMHKLGMPPMNVASGIEIEMPVKIAWLIGE